MYKIEKKKMIIIVILGILTIVSIIKIIDTYFEKNNTKETGILNIISKEETNEETEEKIVIYITGEVLNEGVYELKRGSRIANAIEAAGGTKENANLKNVNLAYELDDGEKIYIPNVNEEETEIVEDGIGEKDEKNKETVININKANSEQLQDLSGIGENTALSIIKYREENGKFNTIEEIMNVPGIGENKFENIKDKIKVK